MSAVESQQVSFWEVHEFLVPVLDRVGSFPMVGTPEWCELDGADPRKLAAVFDAARHHALRLELNQEALAEASREISDAADWSAISREIRNHNNIYIPRKAS